MNRVFLLFLSLMFILGNTSASEVETKKYAQGEWQLLVDGEPYFIKGMVYNSDMIGDDPNIGTLRDFALIDTNGNGRIDAAQESWLDVNENNIQDQDEPSVGDWQMLKDIGCNTLRIYQMPSDDARIAHLYEKAQSRITFYHPANKALFRELFTTYGIRVIVGHFFGEWTLGSGATWENGTDYTDPVQRKNLLDCVRVMVEEHKDEPYLLMWMIGNENFNPHDQDNAEIEIEAFLTLVNEAAELIHSLDPKHPVGLCNLHRSHLKEIAQFSPAIDILGVNAYSGPFGFGSLWGSVKLDFDRPVVLTEFGSSAVYNGEINEDYQMKYHSGCWKDIVYNKYGNNGVGNSIGGCVFAWVDQWFLDGNAWEHDLEGDPNAIPVGMKSEEWFGIVSQGDGSGSPFLRQPRPSFYLYQKLWSEPD